MNRFSTLEIPSQQMDFSSIASTGYTTLNEKSDRMAYMFRLTKTAEPVAYIKGVGLFVDYVRGKPKIKVQIQELYDRSNGDYDTGVPISDPAYPEVNGVAYRSCSEEVIEINDVGYYRIDFSSPPDVSPQMLGHIVAVSIGVDTIDEGANEEVRFAKVNQRDSMNFPYFAHYNQKATNWIHQADFPDVAVIYSVEDVEICVITEMLPVTEIADLEVYANHQSNTRINKAGNIFTLPYTVIVGGVWMFIDSLDADWQLKILDSNDNIVTAVQFYAGQQAGANTSYQAGRRILLPGEFPLVKDSAYKLIIDIDYNSNVNYRCKMREITVNETLFLDQFQGEVEMHKITKAGSSAWVEDNTKRVLMGLLVTGIGGKEKSYVF
jgi:hypothetical protein